MKLKRDARIFRLPGAHFNLFMPGVVGILLVALVVLLGVDNGMSLLSITLVAGIMTLVWMGAAAYSWWMFSRNFLAISHEGMIYSAPGLRLPVYWDELDRIGEYYLKTPAARFNRRLTVIYIREDAHGPVTLRAGLPPTGQPGSWEPVIPIGDFARGGRWKDSEIGRLIQQYAPHLAA